MKKRFVCFLVIFLTIVFSLSMIGCNAAPNTENNVPNTDNNVPSGDNDTSSDKQDEPNLSTYRITYCKGNGGYLVWMNTKYDSPSSYVSFVTDAESARYMPVEAVPFEGFEFAGWSDGVQSAKRCEENLACDVSVTANFKYVYSRYVLNYRGGDCENRIKDVVFDADDFKPIKFPVPHKDKFTFDGWYKGNTRVTDAYGNMVAGAEINDKVGLYLPDNELRAKYKADQTFPYKILLIYVNDIEADLRHKDNKKQIVPVKYTLSNDEKELCKLLTVKFEQLLDYMLDGLVDFQVDEYFLSNKIVTDDFINAGMHTHLFPDIIPEVFDMLDDYDSALTAYSLGENEYDVAPFTGTATEKFGQVLLYDSLFDRISASCSIADFVNAYKTNDGASLPLPLQYIIYGSLNAFAHELAHTVELKLSDSFDYHQVSSYPNGADETYLGLSSYIETFGLRVTRDYLLGEAIIKGEKVGMPYEFWRGDKIVKITYNNEKGGHASPIDNITNTDTALVVKMLNECKVTVQAVPHKGYRFVGWSDGVATAARTDTRTEDYEVTALFEPIV